MMRMINLLAIMAVILTSFALYRVKNDARDEAAAIASLRHEIGKEQAAIDVLKAEWSHLNQPARLQDLASRYLDLKPIDVNQIVTFQELPQRPRESNPYGAQAMPLGGFAGGDVTGSIQ